LAWVLVPLGLAAAGWFALGGEAGPPVDSIKATAAYQRAALLEQAWALPEAAGYRTLVSQPNPSFCGPTSLANALRSLGAQATPHDVVADSGTCRFDFCVGGLTLDELAGLARRKGLQVRVLRELSAAALRDELRAARSTQRRLIANFSRRPLFGEGGGHFSPLGGLLEAEDLVFVLDVNARYAPWLVTPERLAAAINTQDSSSGQLRGLLVLEPTAP
jgi:hypothetical protein